MLTLNDILFGILIPAVLAGSAWGIVWRIWNRNSEPLAGGEWAGALAVSAAFATGYLLYVGWQGYPPKLAEGWLPLIAIILVFAGIIDAALIRSTALRSALWLVVLCISFWLQTEVRRKGWSGTESALWSAGLILTGLVTLLSTNTIAAKRSGASIPLALWVWAAGSAAALGMTGSLKYGFLGGTAAAIMGAALVVALIHPRISFANGATSALHVIVGSMLMNGYFYSDLPASSAVILALAPLILWLGEAGVVTKKAGWVSVVVRACFIGIPVAAALLIAAWPIIFAAPKPYGAY